MIALKLILFVYLIVFVAVGLVAFGRWRSRQWPTDDPYPPEAAEAPDPVEAAFTDVQRIVSDRLPSTTVDLLVRDFNWERYETWLKEPS